MITILRKNRVHNEGCGYDDEWCKHHEDASDDTAEDRHPWLSISSAKLKKEILVSYSLVTAVLH